MTKNRIYIQGRKNVLRTKLPQLSKYKEACMEIMLYYILTPISCGYHPLDKFSKPTICISMPRDVKKPTNVCDC